jgi:transposase-like protein
MGSQQWSMDENAIKTMGLVMYFSQAVWLTLESIRVQVAETRDLSVGPPLDEHLLNETTMVPIARLCSTDHCQ